MPVKRSNSFTPRGKTRGGAADAAAVFSNMTTNGAGLFEAALSLMKGHKMTDEQAAVCVQTYWRRYQAIVENQEARGAAITIQVCLSLPHTMSTTLWPACPWMDGATAACCAPSGEPSRPWRPHFLPA